MFKINPKENSNVNRNSYSNTESYSNYKLISVDSLLDEDEKKKQINNSSIIKEETQKLLGNNNMNQNNNNINKKKKKGRFNLGNYYSQIVWIIIFLLVFIPILIATIFTHKVYNNYYITVNLRDYFLSININMLMILNLMRDYFFDKSMAYKTFTTVKEYFPNVLKLMYSRIREFSSDLESEIIKVGILDKYKELAYGNLCSYSTEFFENYQPKYNCSSFSGDSVPNGLYQVFYFYISTIRYLVSIYRSYNLTTYSYNFIYNLTLEGTSLADEDIPTNSTLQNIYYLYHPLNIFNTLENMELTYLFKFILIPVSDDVYTIIRSASYSKKHILKVYLWPHIVGTILGFFIFCFFWKKYEITLDKTIYKTKKMLGIIPIETLMKVKNIKKLLNIGNSKNMGKKEYENENKVIKWTPCNF